MTYSYTQIASYLRCPRSYRHRYLDGWREKDNRPALLFGRCFEQGLAAFFSGQDSSAVLFSEWSTYQDAQIQYSRGDSWERMFRQGVQLLERLAQDNRIQIRHPQKNMQVKLLRSLPNGSQFVAYIDAMGDLDSKPCLLEWKTTTARYPEEPDGLLALDPQLICYSWMSGIADVAVVAFVRKRFSEIQYLKATISDKQRQEYGQLVETSVSQIEVGRPLQYRQLALVQLIASKLIRKPGASDLDWLDQLDD